jgi:N-formylglutamate amidohydrolase
MSCAPELAEAAVSHLATSGFVVARNKPYAGGFITEHYGRPRQGFHALQVEANRGLYMDEHTLGRGPHFSAVQEVLAGLAEVLATTEIAGAAEAAE